jgi:hypothetical protein
MLQKAVSLEAGQTLSGGCVIGFAEGGDGGTGSIVEEPVGAALEALLVSPVPVFAASICGNSNVEGR